MFEADPGIYDRVGRFQSVADVDNSRATAQVNQLHALLLGNDVDQMPLHNQLLHLQLATGQISNQEAQVYNNMLQTIASRQAARSGQSPAAAMPTAASAAPASQWSPGGAQGPALPAGAPPAALPVTNTPQGQPMPAAVNAAPSAPIGVPAGGAPTLLGMDANDVAGLKFASRGKIDLMPDLKFMLEGVSHPAGAVTTYADGRRERIATLGEGQNQDMNTGAVSTAPGYAASAAEIAGAKTGATKVAENANTPLPTTFVGRDGRPLGGTVGGYIASAAPAAPAAPSATPAVPTSPLDQLDVNPPGQTGAAGTANAAVADMLRRGLDPSTMKVNGAPVNGDLQAQLDSAKQGGAATLLRFQQTVLPKIQAIQDPAQRQQAMAGFLFDLHTPVGTPLHAMQGGTAPAPAASAPASAPQLAGPADLAGMEVASRNAAELATKPAVTSANDLAANDQSRFKAYNEDLDKRAESSMQLQQRNAEMRANLTQFQAGLVGGHVRADLASNLANAFPNSPAIQDAARALVGGTGPEAVAAAQTFNNLVAGAMITNTNQVLDGNGRINKAEISYLQKAAESAGSDPKALARIMAIQDRFGDQVLAEQQALAEARTTGLTPTGDKFNVATWPAAWAKYRRNEMQNPGSIFAPASVQLSTSAPAKTIDFGSLK